MLTEAHTTAFVSESASGRPDNNTAGFGQVHEVESKDVGEVSVDSETSFDTDTASLPTSEAFISYSRQREHAGSQFDSRDGFGRQDRDSVLTNGSSSIIIALCPEPPFPSPTHLSHRLGTQSLQDRPFSVKCSPEAISRISFPVEDRRKS